MTRGPIDRRRIARTVVLLMWAAFFVYLQLSGDLTRYLGPRTYWVVPFGATVLGASALAHVVTLRAGTVSRPIARGEAAGMLLLIAPLIVAVMIPGANLGALAASKKLGSAGGADVGVIAPPAPDSGRSISFIDIHYANDSESYALAAGITAGREVELVGFVTRDAELSDGRFNLTRFYVSCCAADALPYSVLVASENSPAYPNDTWLRVSGVIAEEERGLSLHATEIAEVAEPESPYLY